MDRDEWNRYVEGLREQMVARWAAEDLARDATLDYIKDEKRRTTVLAVIGAVYCVFSVWLTFVGPLWLKVLNLVPQCVFFFFAVRRMLRWNRYMRFRSGKGPRGRG